MRITNSMMSSKMMLNMNSNLRRMDKINNDLTSGVKIHKPSDDPVLVARSLKLHTDLAENDQFKRNIDDAYSMLDKTETSLKELDNVLLRVRDLTVQASNGVLTETDRKNIQAEIKQLKDQMVKVGNDTYIGKYIFSGYQTDKPYLNSDGTFNVNVNSNEQIKYQIGVSADITVNVTGNQIFGPVVDSDNDKIPDKTLMDTINELITNLESSDTSNISAKLKELDIHKDNISEIRGAVGARMNTVEAVKNRIDDMKLNFSKLLSETEDTDMAEAYTQMNIYESVYRASLSVGAKIIQPTLIDFLR